MNDDMPRYQVAYNNYPTYLISRTFMIDIYYVQIDYKNNKTIVSRLYACFLLNSVEVPKALNFDRDNPQNILPKINTIMVFS
jgi:hypothetical protein